MRRHTNLLTVLFALAALALGATSTIGCEDKKDDAAETPSMAEATEVIQGDKPAWPEEVAGASPGDPMTALEGIELEKNKRGDRLTSARYEGVRYAFNETDDGRIKDMDINFREDPEDLAGKLTAAWGEPTKFKSLATEYLVWLNPEAGLRARIMAEEPGWITFERYMPLTDVLGTEAGPLALEKDKPILGKTLDEIGQAWGSMVNGGDRDQLRLPPTHTDVGWTTVFLDTNKAGKVTGYRLDLAAPPDQQQGVLDALEAKLGAPVAGKGLTSELQIYSAPEQQFRVLVAKKDPAISEGFALEVQQYLPLEAIIGPDDKSKLAIEGDTSWLGTAEADWKSKIANDGTRLELWPTSHSERELQVAPKFADGKLVGYELDLRCELRPDSCAEIVEAFKKTFGEPTSERDILNKEVLVFANEPPIALETGALDGYTAVVGPR